MRTIKFRGKNIETGEWVYGFYTRGGYVKEDGTVKVRHIIHSDILYDVEENTIGQYTGLQDKNGIEIYEGDIIFSPKNDCRAILHKVEYNDEYAMFTAKPIQGWDFDFCQIRKDWILKYGKEIIGNIHDNPELLKGE